MTFDQAEFDIRCEWGAQGVANLAPISDVVIIVDVLSFSTCVEIAINRGAIIFPYRWRDETARNYADSLHAKLAEKRGNQYSLSPASMLTILKDTRLVLPSPNGATLSLATGITPTLIGCIRNARAVAQAASQFGSRISVIPCGEKWADDTLRPALEDAIGAGAIISNLAGLHSPEALAQVALWRDAHSDVLARIRQCSSGKELIERGFEVDVDLAAHVNVSECVPLLRQNAITKYRA